MLDRKNWRTWLLMAGSAVLAAGCGTADFPTARVEGSVTLDGQPLAEGTIAFVSQARSGGPSATAQIVAGRYRAQAVPRGKVLVYLHATKDTGRTVEVTRGLPEPEVVNVIPEQYRNGVAIDVASESVKRDFELRSR